MKKKFYLMPKCESFFCNEAEMIATSVRFPIKTNATSNT